MGGGSELSRFLSSVSLALLQDANVSVCNQGWHDRYMSKMVMLRLNLSKGREIPECRSESSTLTQVYHRKRRHLVRQTCFVAVAEAGATSSKAQ
jgi:hypothetical protein